MKVCYTGVTFQIKCLTNQKLSNFPIWSPRRNTTSLISHHFHGVRINDCFLTLQRGCSSGIRSTELRQGSFMMTLGWVCKARGSEFSASHELVPFLFAVVVCIPKCIWMLSNCPPGVQSVVLHLQINKKHAYSLLYVVFFVISSHYPSMSFAVFLWFLSPVLLPSFYLGSPNHMLFPQSPCG